MHKCEHYPELVMRNLEGLELKVSPSLTDEEIEHLQHIAALQRERRMQRSGFGELCQSDLD